ncbi:MAG TPA: CBS domain-containing protein [Anaerolineales bacterium]|jgi:CBS domain-containing protein
MKASRKVSHLLANKGDQVWSIGPDETVYDALVLMADKGIGALLVMQGTAIAGIFSERDYARRVALEGKTSRQTPVRDVMTSDVVVVRPDQSIPDCMALMTNRRIRHLPVVDKDRVVGVVSIGDVVKEIIAEQEFTIEQLEKYIGSNR